MKTITCAQPGSMPRPAFFHLLHKDGVHWLYLIPRSPWRRKTQQIKTAVMRHLVKTIYPLEAPVYNPSFLFIRAWLIIVNGRHA
jgi:hypothetical protein